MIDYDELVELAQQVERLAQSVHQTAEEGSNPNSVVLLFEDLGIDKDGLLKFIELERVPAYQNIFKHTVVDRVAKLSNVIFIDAFMLGCLSARRLEADNDRR